MLLGSDYDEQVDVFAFGIFLAELITQCYLPRDLPRTSATLYSLDNVKFRELVPDDCPSPLMDTVFDCTQYVSRNRPNFEKIVLRLTDIRAALPQFSPRQFPAEFAHDAAENERPKGKKSSAMTKTSHSESANGVNKNESRTQDEESGCPASDHTIVMQEVKFDQVLTGNDEDEEDEIYEIAPIFHKIITNALEDKFPELVAQYITVCELDEFAEDYKVISSEDIATHEEQTHDFEVYEGMTFEHFAVVEVD